MTKAELIKELEKLGPITTLVLLETGTIAARSIDELTEPPSTCGDEMRQNCPCCGRRLAE
jgi:hypothetical protein